MHDGFEPASHSWLMVNGGQGRARQQQVKPVLLGNVGHVDLPLPALSLWSQSSGLEVKQVAAESAAAEQ